MNQKIKLIIRSAYEKFCVCDGRPPAGKENNGQQYLGTVYGWFDTYADADRFLLSREGTI